MVNVGLAGYQMRKPVGLGEYWKARQSSQNDERLGLAREQMEAQKVAAERDYQAQQQRAKGLAAFLGSGVPEGSEMLTDQMPASAMPTNPLARYAPLAAAGYDLDSITALAEMEKAGRTDQIDLMVKGAEMTAQAASMIEALPEDQRADMWMQETKRIEAATGVDIPDNLQVYSPENLAAVKAQALPVLDVWKQQNPAPSASERGYAQAVEDGFTGTQMEYDLLMKRAASTQVNIGGPGEMTFAEYAARERAKAIAEAGGKADVKRLETYAEESDRARSMLEALEAMNAILPNIRTGTLGESALEVQKAAERMGIKLDISGDTSAAELFGALSNQLTLLQRPPGSGEMSNADRDFFQAATANLSKTPEGNALLIDLAMRRARRTMELEGVYQDYIDRKQSGDDVGTWAEIRKDYLDSNPLFTAEDRARVRAASEKARSPDRADASPSRFDSMSREELRQVDIDSLTTVEELDAWTKASRAARQ